MGLFYRAPTPDHTHGTAASHHAQAHREKAQQTAGLPGRGLRVCKGLPACVRPVRFSSHIRDPWGAHLPRSFVDSHENSTQAETGRQQQEVFPGGLGPGFYRVANGFFLVPGAGPFSRLEGGLSERVSRVGPLFLPERLRSKQVLFPRTQ